MDSNYSGSLSYVSSQPVMIPSSRSLLSRDIRLPLDTKNQSGLQEHVFGNQTIQQLTSQLQQMQEQMNSMSVSGDFQDAESNYSGSLSYVSSQLVMIPISRSLLISDIRLPLDIENQSGLQEHVFGN